MDQSIISVDINEVGFLVERGKDIFFTPKAEDALLRLIELDEMVDKAMENAKQMLIAAAEQYNPNFTSVQSDKIKVKYQAYGKKYETEFDFDPKNLPPELCERTVVYTLKSGVDFDSLPENFKGLFDKEIKVTLKTKNIDKYAAVENKLPAGIVAKPRVKQMSFKRIEDMAEEDE